MTEMTSSYLASIQGINYMPWIVQNLIVELMNPAITLDLVIRVVDWILQENFTIDYSNDL